MAYFLNRNFTFILAILTNFKAGLQLNTTLERKNTSVQPNITLEVTTIENEDQLTRIKQTYGQKDEITTILESLSNDCNTTASADPQQGTDQLSTNCVTTDFILNENSSIELSYDETTQRATWYEQSLNKTNSSMNNPSFIATFSPITIAVTLMLFGIIVVILNLIVTVVAYSSKELRRNIYINLVLTLSVNDFLFGLSTLLTGMRMLPFDLFSLRELCIFSVVISPACLVGSLYQTFIISLHRHLTIIGSPWGRILFEEKRHYVWYVGGWIMIVAPLSILISPMRNETDHLCTTDTVFKENKNIAMFIVLVLEFVFILLTVVFYFSAMCCLKRNYMNMSTASNTVLAIRQRKFSKSMKSVSILLLVMLIFSGPFLMRNLLEMIQPISRQEVLVITYILTNVNSLLNPLIYFVNIVEFKMVLKRLCF